MRSRPFLRLSLPVFLLAACSDDPAGVASDVQDTGADAAPVDAPTEDVTVPDTVIADAAEDTAADATDGVDEADVDAADASDAVDEPPEEVVELGDEGDPCDGASECRTDLVCAPDTDLCTAALGCTSHADCGVEAYCDDGECVQNTPGGPCDEDVGCVSGEICATDQCVPEGCNAVAYTAEAVPPNLLVVFDRSGSMHDEIGPDNEEKWDIGREAVYALVAAFDAEINFGLNLFPGFNQSCSQGQDCASGAVNVEVGTATGSAIQSYLEEAGTCTHGTPIEAALNALVDYEGLEDPTRSNFILLMTDGQTTCGQDPVSAVTDLREQDPEIRTFVVGFGGGVDEGELADMAVAGGTARAGDPVYYQADDAEALEEAFLEIGGSVLSCTFSLSEQPPNPNELYVYFDGDPIARDPDQVTGWDFDNGSGFVSFYGEPCDTLRAGEVGELVIVYGCPLPPK